MWATLCTIHAVATARSPARVLAVQTVARTIATNRTPTSRVRCSLYAPPVAAIQPRPTGKSSWNDRGNNAAWAPTGAMNPAISSSGQLGRNRATRPALGAVASEVNRASVMYVTVRPHQSEVSAQFPLFFLDQLHA